MNQLKLTRKKPNTDSLLFWALIVLLTSFICSWAGYHAIYFLIQSTVEPVSKGGFL